MRPSLRQGGRLRTVQGAGARRSERGGWTRPSAPVNARLRFAPSGDMSRDRPSNSGPACTPPAASCARGVKHLPARVPAIPRYAGDAVCRVVLSTGDAGQPAPPTHAGPSRVPGPPSEGNASRTVIAPVRRRDRARRVDKRSAIHRPRCQIGRRRRLTRCRDGALRPSALCTLRRALIRPRRPRRRIGIGLTQSHHIA